MLKHSHKTADYCEETWGYFWAELVFLITHITHLKWLLSLILIIMQKWWKLHLKSDAKIQFLVSEMPWSCSELPPADLKRCSKSSDEDLQERWYFSNLGWLLQTSGTCKYRSSKAKLTNCHHVVPSIQQTHAELQSFWGEACSNKSPTQLWVLAHSRGPGHQKPQHHQQNHSQQPQDPPAGHVRCPLGRAGQEHF